MLKLKNQLLQVQPRRIVAGEGASKRTKRPVRILPHWHLELEAAGIEPASRNISTPASTCVVDSFPPFARRPPTDGVPAQASQAQCFNPGRTRR